MEARVDTGEPPIGACVASGARRHCLLRVLGRTGYPAALKLQLDLHKSVVDGDATGSLILLEHDPVITMGVRTAHSNLLVNPSRLSELGIELVRTDRGGDVTYHGPGQLVGYPIIRLRDLGIDVHGYLRTLEQVIIDTLARFDLEGVRHGNAGVWVGERKVCSIGIAVRRGVTYHGFALNVAPDLSHFELINPCGLSSAQITSMEQLLGCVPEPDEVRSACIESFASLFGVAFVPGSG